MRSPTISVVVPAHNEGARVAKTIASVFATCAEPAEVEVVVVDDGSAPGKAPQVTAIDGHGVRVIRSARRLGVGPARNLGVRHARADIVFITDAHVQLSPGWDREVKACIAPGRILAVTIADQNSDFRGYGCDLVVPHMGTYWNTEPPSPASHVQVASAAGTVIERALFENIGGYDEGMLRYSGFEPEFSVRAWRYGAEICQAPTIQVTHRFKTEAECAKFLRPLRTAIVHNCLRFGVAHLPEIMILEMVRLQAAQFPDEIQKALNMLEERGAWQRRHQLTDSLRHDFAWFAERFALLDQIGEPIPRAADPVGRAPLRP